MTTIICDDGSRYNIEFEAPTAMRVTKNGKVRFEPCDGVRATLEFASPAVRVEEGE